MQAISVFRPEIALIILSVVVIAAGQVIFKFAAGRFVHEAGASTIDLVRLNLMPLGLVGFALFFYLLSTVAWIYALRTVPLSVAFMFNAMAFLIVPVAGFLLFRESIPTYFVPACALIIAGIVLVSL